MKKTSLLVFILFVVAALAKAQSQTPFVKQQNEFKVWSQNKDLSKTKGWKWYKRWEYETTIRSNVKGELPKAAEIYKATQKAIDLKNASYKNSTAPQSGWVPVGPFDLPPSNEEGRQHGMGRINTINFHPTNPDIFYVGVAQGGIWKTMDGGLTWQPITDNLPIIRISDIAIDPIHPDTMYVCLGDYAYIGVALQTDGRKRHTHYGMGVYKTTNGGTTWSATGLSFAQTQYDGSLMRKLYVNPSNTEELVAAGTSGIWKSQNGGTSWTQVLDSLIWDMEKTPANPNVLYAASGYVKNLNTGSAGIMKSTDFGTTWSWLTTGIALQDSVQRIKLAVSASNPNKVYALACDMERGLFGVYRSTDAGANWTRQCDGVTNILEWFDGGSTGGQGTYDLSLLVNPQNEDEIYTGGINIWGSSDGGTSWNPASFWTGDYGTSLHADQHYFAYNNNSGKYYVCNDGGLYSTENIVLHDWSLASGGTPWPTQWEFLSNGLNITSFYRIDVGNTDSEYIVAGAQDNSTFYKNSLGWLNVIGGDGMDCMIDIDDPTTVYGSYQYGNLYRSDDEGNFFTDISPTFDGGEWVTPMAQSATVAEKIYTAYGEVYYSTDKGNSWQQKSNFPQMSNMQVKLSSALAVAPSNDNYIYVAKRIMPDLGESAEMWVTTNLGTSWNNITIGLPDSLYITHIAVHPTNPNTAFATCGGFAQGAKVYKTTNAGSSWQNISNNLPNLPVNSVVVQNDALHHVYIATDLGVYFINDNQATWQSFSQNLPNVIVSDLDIHDATQKLYVSTFGRGIWMSDLATANGLNSTPGKAAVAARLFPSPNNGQFTIHTDVLSHDLQVEIIDVNGRTVYSTVINKGEHTKNISTGLKNGTYYLKLAGNSGMKVIPFTIIKTN